MTRMRRTLLIGLAVFCLGAVSPAVAEEDDPWEGFNRRIFWFNDRVDVYVLEPVAKGWDWALPKPIQTGFSNFFENALVRRVNRRMCIRIVRFDRST